MYKKINARSRHILNLGGHDYFLSLWHGTQLTNLAFTIEGLDEFC